jgi:hypothetical protein
METTDTDLNEKYKTGSNRRSLITTATSNLYSASSSTSPLVGGEREMASPTIALTNDQNDALNTTMTKSRPNSGSSLVYVPYDNHHLLHENRVPFDNVTFCFKCDKSSSSCQLIMGSRKSQSTPDYSSDSFTTKKKKNRSEGSVKRRPRSVSSMRLKESIEPTGFQLDNDGISAKRVYRRVFLCNECYIQVQEDKKENSTFRLKMTDNARTTYY